MESRRTDEPFVRRSRVSAGFFSTSALQESLIPLIGAQAVQRDPPPTKSYPRDPVAVTAIRRVRRDSRPARDGRQERQNDTLKLSYARS